METGTKVLIGVGAAAVAGAIIYFGFIRKAEEVVAGTTGGGTTPAPVPAGGNGQPPKDKTKAQKILDEAKKKMKDLQCNIKHPPPRFKKEKQKAYRDCLHSVDAVMHNAAGTWGS